MADIQWIKLSTDVFNNRKIKAIEDMPDGDALLVIWFKLLVLAGETNDNGLVYFTRDIPFTNELLSTQFNKSLPTIQLALATFVRFGMINIVNDIICVSNWEKYQNVDGLDKVREQTRKRVAEYRDRQKALLTGNNNDCEHCNVTNNDDVTLRNGTDKEIDIDIEKDNKEEINKEDLEFLNSMSKKHDISNKKQAKTTDKRGLVSVLDENSISGELRDALIDFIDMRDKKKRPLTQRAFRSVINKLFKLSDDYSIQIKIVDQALEHSWDTVYELKNGYQGNRVGANGVKLADTEDHSLDGIF